MTIIVGSLPLYDFEPPEDWYGTETSITSAVGTDVLSRADCKRLGLVQTHQDRFRVVLSSMIVVAVAAGLVALLSIRPTVDIKRETGKPVETTTLGESDRSKIGRLRQVGKDMPWHWRRRQVRRTAPSLSRWIDGMSMLLSTTDADRVPAALYDRLALSFKSHELMRARFVIDADTVAVARDAGYHFGRRYAITFGDIIVFRDADAARDEIEWAR